MPWCSTCASGPKKRIQPVFEIRRRGSDWSGWSPVYVETDAIFLSPSPRSFVQLQVKLGNHNPEVTPLLSSIVLHFDDALVSGGVEVVPMAVAMVADSLQVDLPQRVRRDSVEVEFQTRIQANATTFDAWISVVGESLRQGTRPEADEAVTVFVPSVASAGALIRQIEVSPLVSPNGDGINDEASITFALAKGGGHGAGGGDLRPVWPTGAGVGSARRWLPLGRPRPGRTAFAAGRVYLPDRAGRRHRRRDRSSRHRSRLLSDDDQNSQFSSSKHVPPTFASDSG